MVTCADVRGTSEVDLQKLVGKFASNLYGYSFGRDERSVVSSRVRKSVGVERTFAEDLHSEQACLNLIDKLYEKLQKRLEPHKTRVIAKQGIKLKFADFTQTTVEHQSSEPNFEEYKQLLSTAFERGAGKPIRLIGLTVGFKEVSEKSTEHQAANQNQLELFS